MTGPLAAASWFLALRYLLTRWVNLLGIVGIAVAVWALIVVIAVFSGFIAGIRDHIRGATADLVLTGLRENASYDLVRPLLERDPDVVATAPRLQHYGIFFPHGPRRDVVVATSSLELAAGRFNFVTLIGVDPEREAATTRFHDWLTAVPHERLRVHDVAQPFRVPHEALVRAAMLSGDTSTRSGAPQYESIILPSSHLRSIAVEPGQLVDLVSARFDRDGDGERLMQIRRLLPVSGGFLTRHRGFDEATAFVHIETLRSMFGLDPEVGGIDLITEVAVRARDGADLLALARRLEGELRPLTGGVVRTWEQQNAVFLGAVEQERALMRLVLFAVMLVAAFLVYATLHMMVTQKTKDIGVLTAIGAAPALVASIFVACACILATVGVATGALAGIGSTLVLNDVNDWLRERYQVELFPTSIYALPEIPYRLDPVWIATVIGAAFVLALLVALVPALRAARLSPVKALSYE